MGEEYSLQDVHDATFEGRVQAAWDRDFATLLSRRAEFVAGPCPACGSARRGPAFRCKGFEHVRCDDCATLYIDPCPPEPLILWFHDHSEALRIWRDERPAATRASRLPMYRERLAYVEQALARAGVRARSLLEVGAGSGELAELVVASGRFERVVIVEPQPLETALPGVEVVHGSFESVTVDRPVDVLVAFEVVEHLVDPSRFLDMVNRCLAPGGLMVLTMPSGTGFEVDILRERSSSVPFDHVRLYNPRSLALLLGRHGFVDLAIETPGKFDVDMIHRVWEKGELDLSARPELELLMQPGREPLRVELQQLLAATGRSSHMRCVARRPPR